MNAAEESHAWKLFAGSKLVRTLLAIAVGGMCGIASAANYYVSSTYEGADSDGSQEKPFTTIQAALGNPNLSTDDSVLIGNGTYQISSELRIFIRSFVTAMRRDLIRLERSRTVCGETFPLFTKRQGACKV